MKEYDEEDLLEEENEIKEEAQEILNNHPAPYEMNHIHHIASSCQGLLEIFSDFSDDISEITSGWSDVLVQNETK